MKSKFYLKSSANGSKASVAKECLPAINRIPGFDLLRGICAIAVLVYHVLAWNEVAHIHNLGTYGVYIFFSLSGASMYVAYAQKFKKGYSLSRFLILRLVRLVPLYLLAMIIALLVKFVLLGFDLQKFGAAFLNLFFLFGFGNPGLTSQVTGGWSLGIEFVFYMIFPIVLSFVIGRGWQWVLVITFFTQHVFVNMVLGNEKSLIENWGNYTQFLAFIFYFFAGCVIGRLALERPPVWPGLPAFVVALFVLALSSGDRSSDTLIGITGAGLSLVAITAVASSATLRFGSFGLWVADLLGKSSYGIYLLHPFIAGIMKKFLAPLPLVVLTLASSMILALALERFFERPIQRYFRKKIEC